MVLDFAPPMNEVMMLSAIVQNFDELTHDEQQRVSNNGSGKKYASYLRVIHDGDTILLKSSAMEPEDVSFYRDLSWIAGALENVYRLGKSHTTDA